MSKANSQDKDLIEDSAAAQEEEEGEEEEEAEQEMNSNVFEEGQEGQRNKNASDTTKPDAVTNDGATGHPAFNLASVVDQAMLDEKFIEEKRAEKAKRDGHFEVHGKHVIYDRRSLWCLNSDTSIRKGIVWLIEWKWFDRFITFVILGNSIMLAMTDYKDRIYGPTYVSELNAQLELVDLAFTAIFIFECVSKVLGMGFVVHRNSYLRDGWNWLDFFVVCVSLVNFVPNINSGGLKALRTFRILRPLRTINAIPMMKQQIQSLLKALPGLANILTFLMMVYSIFAIFAVQSFAGNQYQYCRMTEKPDIVKDADGLVTSYDWPIVDTFSWLCKNDDDCRKLVGLFGPDDLEVFKCGASIDYGVRAGGVEKYDSTVQNEQILFDVVNFNHMGLAFLTIFQSLTMESWTTLMYNYMDSNNVGISVFFFIFLVIFGAFFTMQLVLAEIIESFQREKRIRENEAREKEIEKFQEMLLENKKISQAETGTSPRESEQNDADPFAQEEVKEEVFDDSAFEDETGPERDARRRSHTSCLYRMFFVFVTNPFFNCFIFLMILLNTISLAADDYPMTNKKETIIAICNQYFTWLFTVEMICKLIGLGPSNYRQDTYNMFDCFIVCISLIDWTIGMTVGDNVGPAGAVLQAFRAMRLLRIIKLARRWTALQDILGKIFKSLSELSIFCCLLLLFMYIFALLGMQFFAMRAYTDLDDVIVPAEEILERMQGGEVLIPVRVSFNNIYLSLTTVFCVIFAEDWNWDMYYNVVTFGVNLHYYAMFFIIVFAFGNYVLFALFAAILLSHFEGGEEEEAPIEEEEEDSDRNEGLEVEQKEKKSFFRRVFSRETGQLFKKAFIDMFGKRLRSDTLTEADKNKDPLGLEADANQADVDTIGKEDVKGKEEDNKAPILIETSRPAIDEQSKAFSPRAGMDNLSEHNASGTKAQVVSTNKVTPNIQDESQSSESMYSENEVPKNALTSKLTKSTSVLLRHYSTNKDEDSLGGLLDYNDVCGNVFWCIGPENPLRVAAARLEKSKGFNNLILVLIAVSTINLAIETPLDKPGIRKLIILQYIDYFMTAAFTFEMCIKIFVYGFLLTGDYAYLKQGWNCLDFVIVLSALIGLNPNATASLKSLKTLRILRVLRPLKLASKNKGLKVAITALFKSLPAIGNLQLIILFFLFLFGILHTTLFAGQFWSCSGDHISLTYEEQAVGIESMWDCLNYGGEWVNSDFNFDQTLRSVLTLFCLQSTEGWVDSMWQEVDTTDKYMQPKMNNKPIFIIFGIFIEILINLLFLNLFVGVVIETFNEEKEKINKNNLLEDDQKKWIQVQLMGYQATPIFKQGMTGSCFRDIMIKMVEHSAFDTFIMGCIIANTIVLMIKWYGMSESVVNLIQNVNYGFMAIFTLEAIFKLIALRKNYFRVGWNIFDFSVVVGTLIILVIGFLDLGEFGIQSTILRSLRIGRVLRILRKFKKLQIIFNTLIEALTPMASLGMLLLLLMFMYAIIGMSQFGFINITDQENADYHANFRNFLDSFLLLFRCATGEAWDSLMFDFGRGYSIMFQCDLEMEYESWEANGFVSNKCGNATVAYVFFISFIIFCVQVFLNLFVAVIVDSFANQAAKADLPVQQIDIDFFCETWREFDGEAKGFIKTVDLDSFILRLVANEYCQLIMYRRKIEVHEFARRAFIADLDIPTFKNFRYVMFYDVLLALIKEKSKFCFVRDYYDMKRKNDSKRRELKEASSLMSDKQISKIANREFPLCKVGDNFDLHLEGFIDLPEGIELVNEIAKSSKAVSTKFKLHREKADECVCEETGTITYYTTRQFIYGTWIVETWRKYIQYSKEQEEAAFGEIINGKRKIKPNDAYAKTVTNVPYPTGKPDEEDLDVKMPQRELEKPSSNAGTHNNQGATIVDTDFGKL